MIPTQNSVNNHRSTMSSHKILVFPTLVALAVFVRSDQIPDFVTAGKCPVIDEQKLWEQQLPNHSKFGGTWYQQAISTNPYQLLKDCVVNQYDFNGKSFDAKCTGVTEEGNILKRVGTLEPMPLGDPHLMAKFENSFPAPLVILDTDYTNYACLYSCLDYNYDYHSDFAFYYTRDVTTGDSYRGKCDAVFKSIGVDPARLIKTVHGTKCQYEAMKRLRDEL